MRRFHSPSKATVLALLALTVSLSGTGFAFGRGASNQAPAAAAAVQWHALTLRSGWVYADYDSYHAAYYKDSGGRAPSRIAVERDDWRRFQAPARGTTQPHALALGLRTQRIDRWSRDRSAGWAYAFDDNSNANVSGYTSLDGVSFRVP
jgi:hypothetical protein